ncbi:hypothetical protein D3C86_1239360 [compost metagenome]
MVEVGEPHLTLLKPLREVITAQRLPTDDLGDSTLLGFADISEFPLIQAGDVVADVDDTTFWLEATMVGFDHGVDLVPGLHVGFREAQQTTCKFTHD